MQISSKEFKKISQKKHKYNAKSCEIDGMKFSSKLEGQYYLYLKERLELGAVKLFLRQIPFHLPGNVKYILDFLVMWKNESVSYVEVKGYDTPISKLKRKIVEDIYPIKILIVKKIPEN